MTYGSHSGAGVYEDVEARHSWIDAVVLHSLHHLVRFISLPRDQGDLFEQYLRNSSWSETLPTLQAFHSKHAVQVQNGRNTLATLAAYKTQPTLRGPFQRLLSPSKSGNTWRKVEKDNCKGPRRGYLILQQKEGRSLVSRTSWRWRGSPVGTSFASGMLALR